MDGVTRTAADVQAEIDALEAVDSACIKAAVDTRTGIDEALGFHLETLAKAEPLKAEHARLEREEFDATVSERNRGWAMALREAWLGQDPFAELDEDDYITNRDLERLEAWKHLPLDEVRRWARVADALERGWW